MPKLTPSKQLRLHSTDPCREFWLFSQYRMATQMQCWAWVPQLCVLVLCWHCYPAHRFGVSLVSIILGILSWDCRQNGHLKIHFYLDGILFFFVRTTQQRNQAPRPFFPSAPHHLLTWSSSMSCSCCPACLSLSPRSIILPYNFFHFFWSSDIFSWIETAA